MGYQGGGGSGRAGLLVAQANSKLARDMPDPVEYRFDFDRYRGLLESLESPDVKVTDLADAGGFLGELLLIPAVWELFHEAYSSLASSEGLRLRVRCKDHVMKQLPWEFARIDMGDGAEPAPLAVNPRLSLVRYEELQFPPPVPELRTELVVSALDAGRAGGRSYVDLPPDSLDVPRRYDDLPVDFLPVAQATRESLEMALRGQRVDIFHFTGHGERSKGAGLPPGLVLDYSDRRGADILTGADLAPILDRAGVSLAVVSACHAGEATPVAYGGGVALALVHAGIPIVVAMQHQIEATHATEFNKSFYASLFSGATVDEAVSFGRIRLHELGAHYGRPVLYHRSDSGAFLQPIAHSQSPADETRLVLTRIRE
ncbi:MAG: CHAT domain-containing protein [Pseudonocardiaceae bacterium]